eukprot:10120693-Lingulodinium_polyedra.AAC.1
MALDLLEQVDLPPGPVTIAPTRGGCGAMKRAAFWAPRSDGQPAGEGRSSGRMSDGGAHGS